jgi:hypothetical protein
MQDRHPNIDDRVLSRLRDPRLAVVRQRHIDRLAPLPRVPRPSEVVVLCGWEEYTEAAALDGSQFLAEALPRLAEHAAKGLDEDVFRPLAVTYNPRGVHFVDHIFHAEVFQLGVSWQARPLAQPVGTLAEPDVDADDGVRAARQFATELLRLDLPGVLLGMPTLSSTLNIAVNLYGQDILLAMMQDAHAARRDLGVIHEAILAGHDWYLKNVPESQRQCILPGQRCQPPGRGQLCGCTTHLLSARLYAEFIAPLDEALLAAYPDGGMIHLCGAHAQHIPVWREMRPLRALQLNDRAAEDLAIYRAGLRPDQVLYVNPCAAMPVDRIMQITGGERVVVVANLEHRPPVPPRQT